MPTSRPPQRKSWSAPRLELGDIASLPAARRVVEGALSVVPGERLVVIVDREARDVATSLERAGALVPATVDVVVLEDLGPRPLSVLPAMLGAKLETVQASAFVARALPGELELRRALTREVERLGLRHAHMIDITRERLIAGLAVDPQRVSDVARMLRVRLRDDSVLQVRSAAGTDLRVQCAPGVRWIVHGGVIRPGRWQNLPAAEMFTSPANVEGRYVADASHSGLVGLAGTNLREAPITLEVQGGLVTRHECSVAELRDALGAFLDLGEHTRRVGLAVLGTNLGLDRAEGAIVLDQTLPGLHLVLGRSHAALTGASWDGREELTLAAYGTDVDIDGEGVVRNGRYLL